MTIDQPHPIYWVSTAFIYSPPPPIPPPSTSPHPSQSVQTFFQFRQETTLPLFCDLHPHPPSQLNSTDCCSDDCITPAQLQWWALSTCKGIEWCGRSLRQSLSRTAGGQTKGLKGALNWSMHPTTHFEQENNTPLYSGPSVIRPSRSSKLFTIRIIQLSISLEIYFVAKGSGSTVP